MSVTYSSSPVQCMKRDTLFNAGRPPHVSTSPLGKLALLFKELQLGNMFFIQMDEEPQAGVAVLLCKRMGLKSLSVCVKE